MTRLLGLSYEIVYKMKEHDQNDKADEDFEKVRTALEKKKVPSKKKPTKFKFELTEEDKEWLRSLNIKP